MFRLQRNVYPNFTPYVLQLHTAQKNKWQIAGDSEDKNDEIDAKKQNESVRPHS